jgi:uncharacterized protein (DUF488 family)
LREPTITTAHRVSTVGHSNRSAEALLELLTAAGVDMLVDVRSFPHSRTNPQFNAERLAPALAASGVGYCHIPALGGRRGRQDLGRPSPNARWRNEAFRNYADYALSPVFRAGLDELLALARAQHCAIMCAEALWWRCHRQIIADYLLVAGVPVMHILGPDKIEAARLTPGAVPQPDGAVHYPAAQGALL